MAHRKRFVFQRNQRPTELTGNVVVVLSGLQTEHPPDRFVGNTGIDVVTMAGENAVDNRITQEFLEIKLRFDRQKRFVFAAEVAVARRYFHAQRVAFPGTSVAGF